MDFLWTEIKNCQKCHFRPHIDFQKWPSGLFLRIFDQNLPCLALDLTPLLDNFFRQCENFSDLREFFSNWREIFHRREFFQTCRNFFSDSREFFSPSKKKIIFLNSRKKIAKKRTFFLTGKIFSLHLIFL